MFEELKKIYDYGKPSKLICKKYKKEYLYLLSNTKFLDDQIIDNYKIKIVQRLYHLINNIKDIPKCKYCGHLVEFNSYREYRIYCSNKCKIFDANYAKRIEKAKITKLFKYGNEKYNNNEKAKQTCLEKYGTEYTFQNKQIKEKTKQTKLKLYGDEYFSNWEKGKKTCKERYDVNSNLWIKEIRDKIKINSIEKCGYDHHTKSPEYVQGFNNKIYNFSSKQVSIQGYEDWAIDLLLLKYNEDDIIVGKHQIFTHLGKIEYEHDNKIHSYYPDIFIKSKNLIIEVKSWWTFKKKNEIILVKRKICLDKGFNFNFWIFDSNKNLTIL